MSLFSRWKAPGSQPGPPPGPRVLSRGRHTVLREFARPDIDRWTEWPRHDDPLFENYNPPVLTARQRDDYYRERLRCPTSRQYSVDDLENRFVGRISLREMDPSRGMAVLGLSFHPRRLGQGLGSDAMLVFLRHYFTQMRMRALYLDVAAFNHRARRLYDRCGFRACGQRWGDSQTDYAGVFHRPQYESIRPLFMWDYGLIRPLVIDMVLYRAQWERLREEPAAVSRIGLPV